MACPGAASTISSPPSTTKIPLTNTLLIPIGSMLDLDNLLGSQQY
ncbi:hypothetical protein JCM19233_5949 [Vibrio astriarenae]|nr:hypothetical protein JCM19233_5949 [Vibrio sp. C7]